MPNIIDVHAHVTPRCFSDVVLGGNDWHGMTSDDGELHNPMNLWSLDQRIEAMDSDGIDVQLTSPTDVFYQYHQDPAVTATIAAEVNDEVAEMVRSQRVAELTRAIRDLGLRGVMMTTRRRHDYDDPRFEAFWQAAEELGALIFVH